MKELRGHTPLVDAEFQSAASEICRRARLGTSTPQRAGIVFVKGGALHASLWQFEKSWKPVRAGVIEEQPAHHVHRDGKQMRAILPRHADHVPVLTIAEIAFGHQLSPIEN
jgi:hypothetical protein